MADWRNFGRDVRRAADAVVSKSIMNPLLWLDAIIGVPSIVAAYFFAEPYKFYFFLLGLLLAVSTIAIYIFFVIADRDRLQDEEYRLRDKALNIIGDSSTGYLPRNMDRIIHGQAYTPALIEHQAKGVQGDG